MPRTKPLSSPDLLRLSSLRRLYHHVVHSGQTTSRDEAWLGEPVTIDSLSRQIRELEQGSTPTSSADEQH